MRTVWTNEEKRAVFEEATVICTLRPNLTNKALLAEAQQALPMERRLKITDQRVFSYKDRLSKARFDAMQVIKIPEVKEPEPAPAPTEPVRKIDGLGDLFELLVDAIADRLMDKMIAAKELHEKMQEPVEEKPLAFGRGWLDELENLSIRSKEAKVKKPTVFIIGLNGHQMECVKQTRPEVDFTFATAEQALSQYVIHRDHTILMTKFINHSVQTKYRKHPNLHYCNGGVSELKTLLHGLFAKVPA